MATAAKPHVFTVPRVLYEELSASLGMGDERKVTTTWRQQPYRIRELDSAKAGFPGAVGVHEEEDAATFAFWGSVPRGDGTIFEPEPVLLLEARAFGRGEWCAGVGQRLRETAKLEFGRELSPDAPSLTLLSRILERARALFLESERAEYWEKDRNPAGTYMKP